MTTITIPTDYLRNCRPWKSEQQHINEFLYCEGLPFRQNDLTDKQTGMQYVGQPTALTSEQQEDGSITVQFAGETSGRRELPRAKKRIAPTITEWGF